MAELIYLKGVVTLRLDQKKCTGCGMCLLVCPHAVLRMSNGTVEIATQDACMECGACARNCPAEALSVRAGVGCAVAVLNSKLKRKSACCAVDSEGSGCSCSLDDYEKDGGKGR